MQMISDSHPVDNPDASKTDLALTPQLQVMTEVGAFVYFPLEDPDCFRTFTTVVASVQAQCQPCMDPAGHSAGVEP